LTNIYYLKNLKNFNKSYLCNSDLEHFPYFCAYCIQNGESPGLDNFNESDQEAYLEVAYPYLPAEYKEDPWIKKIKKKSTKNKNSKRLKTPNRFVKLFNKCEDKYEEEQE